MSYSKTYLNRICSGFLTFCSGNYLYTCTQAVCETRQSLGLENHFQYLTLYLYVILLLLFLLQKHQTLFLILKKEAWLGSDTTSKRDEIHHCWVAFLLFLFSFQKLRTSLY